MRNCFSDTEPIVIHLIRGAFCLCRLNPTSASRPKMIETEGRMDGRKKRNRIDLKGDLRGIIYGMHREWFLSHWLNYSSQSLSSHLTLDRNWLWEGAAALTNLFNIAQVAMNSIGPVSIQNYHNQSTSNRSISQNGRHSFRLSQYDKGASFRSMDRR